MLIYARRVLLKSQKVPGVGGNALSINTEKGERN